MILDIAQFDHPALRTPGSPIQKIDSSLRDLVADMVETMREADGLGIAAQQVGLPLQLFVLDVPQLKKRPSAMRIGGRRAEFEPLMPLILIEGCLSFPEISARVARPLSVRVKALGLDGATIEFEADGLLARAVQHELDHTRGILFIDRAIEEDRLELPDDIRRLVRPAPPA